MRPGPADSTLAARCPRRDFGKSHFWGSYIQAKRSRALRKKCFAGSTVGLNECAVAGA